MPGIIIRHIQQYGSISPQAVSWLHAHVKGKTLPKGGYLVLDEGDFAFVDNGLLKQVDSDTEAVSHFVAENDFVIYPSAHEHLYYIALEPCSIRYIHHHELLYLLSADRSICHAYDKLLRYWALQQVHVHKLLRMPAVARKEAFYHHFRAMASRIPSKDIASYLDISPSYFSQL